MDVLSYALSKKYTNEQINEQKLKVAKLEQELNNYKSVMSQVNVNQEATQKVSGYSVLSLPRNAANGQFSDVTLSGNTRRNLLTENQSSVETDITGFVADGDVGASISISRDTIEKVFGNASLKVVTDGSKVHQGMRVGGVKGINGKTYIGSAYVKAPSGASMQLLLRIENTTTYTTINFIGTGDWQRVSTVLTLDTDTTDLNLRIRTTSIPQAITFYVDGLMIEEGTELREFILGGGTKSTVCAGRIRSVGKNLYKEPKSLSDLRYKTENSVVTFYEDYTEFGQKGIYSIAYSKPIKLKPNTLYMLSVDGVKTSTYGRVQVRDDLGSGLGNGVLLGQCIIPTTRARVSGTFTTPPNGIVYIWYYVNSDETVGSMKIYSVQIEEGSRTTPYESYQESTQYVVVRDPVTGEILQARSLPNGTKDEITVNEGKLIKRISDELVLNGSESWSQVNNTTYSTDILRFDINITDVKPSHDYSVLSDKFISGAYNDGGTYWNTVENIRTHGSQPTIHIFINKSRLATADVAGFKAWLTANPVTVIYQLAEPEYIPVEVSGNLITYPSGTIYVEKAVADAGIYSNGITALYQDLPISEIEKLSKIDFTTGLETELDPSDCIISDDKLSFTHPELQDGDIVFFTYFYDVESTEGELEVEYYDSRYVIKDSVTGKFYKWNIAVANGIPTIEVQEV